METKRLVNQALKFIGEHGFSGVSMSATSAVSALSTSLNLDQTISTKLINELRRQALAEIKSHKDQVSFRLTPKGLHRLQQSLIGELAIRTQETWDRHWRIIMFDVPTRHNRQRTLLTTQLKRMGFVLLRDSTWAYPYPCFSQLDQLVRFCNLAQFVTYAEVTKLDNISHKRLLRSFVELS